MKLLYLLFISACILFANSDLKWVDDQIEAIKPNRVGIDSSYVDALKDPVVVKTVDQPDSKTASGKSAPSYAGKSARKLELRPLTLEAVFNDAAYINGHWYKLNEKVRGLNLSYINDDYIILSGKKKKTRLFVNNKNSKIKITTR